MHRAVEIALGEVGYLEKDTPEALDEKETSAGSANFTKYARDMDAISRFYNGSKLDDQRFQGGDICIDSRDWKKYSLVFTAEKTVEKASAWMC